MNKILLVLVVFISFFWFYPVSTFADSSIHTSVLSNTTFSKLGIELKENIADTYYTGDGLLIIGRVTDNKKYVIFYLRNIDSWEEVSDLYPTNVDGSFRIPIALPNIVWKYYIIIASGNSFETTNPEVLRLIDKSSISSADKIVSSISMKPTIVYGKFPYLYFGSNIWTTLKITQWSKVVQKSGKIIMFDGISLRQWNAKISTVWYPLSSPSSLNQIRSSWKSWIGNVYIDRTREMIWRELVSLRVMKNIWIMQFRLKKWSKVSSIYFLTHPNGYVTKYSFPKESIDSNGLLRTEILIKQPFPMPDSGIYKIETVQSNGYAYFNLPISKNLFWSIVEPFTESQISTLRNDKSWIDNSILASINIIRIWLNLTPLALDGRLSELAQKKALDMAKYDYVGHTTHSGMGIIEFAKSQNIAINGGIGENVAGWNVSDLNLQDGLEESGSHRHNMIDERWKKVGIGYVLQNGKTYLVQLFGN